MAQLPKHRVELIGKGVTGACIALVTLLVVTLVAMVAQSGIATFAVDGIDLGTFLTGTTNLDLPFGRILRDENGEFLRVVEDKDCTPEQKNIRELNAGVYAFDCQELLACLELLKNDNAQGEYYLTDVPELMRQRGGKIGLCCVELGPQIIGVNMSNAQFTACYLHALPTIIHKPVVPLTYDTTPPCPSPLNI